MFILQIGNTFFFFPGSWIPASPGRFTELVLLGARYIQVCPFATRYKLVGFLVKNPVKAHGIGVPVCCVLPASVCFKILPVPCQACSLLEAAVVLGRARHRGSCWWGLTLKPDAGLKRRWENRAQLGNLFCEQQSHQWESGL